LLCDSCSCAFCFVFGFSVACHHAEVLSHLLKFLVA
jgi:hypothetical protein